MPMRTSNRGTFRIMRVCLEFRIKTLLNIVFKCNWLGVNLETILQKKHTPRKRLRAYRFDLTVRWSVEAAGSRAMSCHHVLRELMSSHISDNPTVITSTWLA